MVRAPVNALDDDIGGPLDLVVQSTRDQPTEHRLGRLIPVQSETGHVRLVTRPRHRPVHRLDDIAADAEGAQRRLEARLHLPSCRTDLLRKPKAFELARSPDHQPLQFGGFSVAAGAEVNHTTALIGDVTQRAIEARPVLRLDLLLQGGSENALVSASADWASNILAFAPSRVTPSRLR